MSTDDWSGQEKTSGAREGYWNTFDFKICYLTSQFWWKFATDE